MVQILSYCGLVLLVIITRILPRILSPNATGSDTFYHLLCARAIRQNRWKLPERIYGLCFPSPYDYPPLYHYLLAIIPPQWDMKAERWLGAILDGINTLVFCFVAYLMLPPVPAIISAGLFGMAPAHTSTTTGPRAFQATPRLLGELLFNAATLSMVAWKITGTFAWIITGWIIGSSVLLSSKYSTQVMVFFWPAIGIISGEWSIALGPIFSGIIAILLSKGHYLKILKGQIGHLNLFYKWTSSKLSYVAQRNKLEDFLNLPRNLIANPKAALRTLFINNSYSKGIINNPILVILVWLAIQRKPWFIDPTGGILWGWLGIAVAVWLATGLKPLLFLGEAERYLTHAVAPQALLTGTLIAHRLMSIEAALAMLALFLFFFYPLNIAIFCHYYNAGSSLSFQVKDAGDFLKSHFNLPLKFISIGGPGYRFAYLSQYEVFYSSGNFATCYYPVEFYEKLFITPGTVRPPLLEVMEKFNLDGVLVKKQAMASLGGYPWDFDKLWQVWDSSAISIYIKPELIPSNTKGSSNDQLHSDKTVHGEWRKKNSG